MRLVRVDTRRPRDEQVDPIPNFFSRAFRRRFHHQRQEIDTHNPCESPLIRSYGGSLLSRTGWAVHAWV